MSSNMSKRISKMSVFELLESGDSIANNVFIYHKAGLYIFYTRKSIP